ncbi:MAG: peptide deformylase [Planctomycetes bacterium]|nr:peptide deformylase [Planctomycetota bacterium]
MTDTASPASYPTHPALVCYPAPVLRRKAEPVTVFDEDLRAFCARMFAVMEAEKGVGLAAPQVGVSRRIFVTDHARKKDGEKPDPRVWVNPVIESPEGVTTYEEGCLSFPAIYAKVKRHDRFTIRWLDEYGRERSERLDVGAGQFLGIVVQHELDHLDGIVFIDHLTPVQLGLCRRRLRDLEADYRKATGKTGSPIRR